MARLFPIFNCPSAVAKRRLKNMECGELFELSLLSKRGFELAKNTALLHKQPSFLEIVLSSTTTVRYHCGDDRIEWHFYGKRDSKGIDLEDSKQLTVKMQTETPGVVRKLVFATKIWYCYGCSSPSIQDVLLFIQHISSLFNSKTRWLDIREPQLSNLKVIQSVQELRTSKNVTIHESTVTNDEMRQIIEGFESEALQILCKPERDFSYNSRISVKDFRAFNGSWFKDSMLLNVDSEVVAIKSRKISDEDVNKFLHQWMKNTSGCGKVRALTLIRIIEKDRLTRWNFDKITEGLENPLDCDFAFIKKYWRTMDNMRLFIKLDDSEEAVSKLHAAAQELQY